MLILLQQIARRGAEYAPPLRPLGINPEQIDRATAGEVLGFDGSCVKLECGDETLFVVGTVPEIVQKTWVYPCPEPENTDTES